MSKVLLKALALAFLCLFEALTTTRSTSMTAGLTSTSKSTNVGWDDNERSCKLLKFDGGGIFYWYQAGACKYLQEAGFSSSSSELSIMGTSAGSLSATMLLVNSNFDDAAEFAISQCVREKLFEKPTGLAFRWGTIIEEWLQAMIDEKYCDPATLSRLIITATSMKTLRPWVEKKQTFLSGFKDKNELINANMCSVHIPFFLDRKLYTKYYHEREENQVKGRDYSRFIDGSFWPFMGRSATDVPRSLVRGCEEEDGVLLPHEIYTCGDWKADQTFSARIEGDTSFLSLVTPEGLYDMMKSGYEHQRGEHEAGRVPSNVLSAPSIAVQR